MPNLGTLRQGLADLSGFDALRFKIRLNKGMRWNLALTEDGEGPRDAASFKGLFGSDGEQYIYPEQIASGAWDEVTIHFSALMPQLWYGNQKGNRVLDLQAIKVVTIGVPQNQGEGDLSIESVEAVRQ